MNIRTQKLHGLEHFMTEPIKYVERQFVPEISAMH